MVHSDCYNCVLALFKSLHVKISDSVGKSLGIPHHLFSDYIIRSTDYFTPHPSSKDMY